MRVTPSSSIGIGSVTEADGGSGVNVTGAGSIRLRRTCTVSSNCKDTTRLLHAFEEHCSSGHSAKFDKQSK